MDEEKLKEELNNINDGLDSVSWSLSNLIDNLNIESTTNINKVLIIFENYVRDLQRQNLWSKELDEHLQLFVKFDFPSLL